MKSENQILREALAEALDRGHFDPFFPFKRIRELCGDAYPKPERSYDEQEEWEKSIGVKRINSWTEA